MLMVNLQEAGVEAEADPLADIDAVDAKPTSPQAKVQFRPVPRIFAVGISCWTVR
jgi:hypothetical protein